MERLKQRVFHQATLNKTRIRAHEYVVTLFYSCSIIQKGFRACSVFRTNLHLCLYQQEVKQQLKSQKSFYHIQLIFKFNQTSKTDFKLDHKDTFRSISSQVDLKYRITRGYHDFITISPKCSITQPCTTGQIMAGLLRYSHY